MAVKSRHPLFHRRRYTVERRFQGSVFDVADARRFARLTANWWGVDVQPVDQAVDRLARRAVCSERPGFRLLLSLDGADVEVLVEGIGAESPPRESRSGFGTLSSRGVASPVKPTR
jgi:hypothetical protein